MTNVFYCSILRWYVLVLWQTSRGVHASNCKHQSPNKVGKKYEIICLSTIYVYCCFIFHLQQWHIFPCVSYQIRDARVPCSVVVTQFAVWNSILHWYLDMDLAVWLHEIISPDNSYCIWIHQCMLMIQPWSLRQFQLSKKGN